MGYVGGGYSNVKQRGALLKDWMDWSGICSQMFWRPNFMKEGEGFPLVWAARMGHDLKHLISTGLVGVEMPNVHHHRGTQGLNYYMLARLMWAAGDLSRNVTMRLRRLGYPWILADIVAAKLPAAGERCTESLLGNLTPIVRSMHEERGFPIEYAQRGAASIDECDEWAPALFRTVLGQKSTPKVATKTRGSLVRTRTTFPVEVEARGTASVVSRTLRMLSCIR